MRWITLRKESGQEVREFTNTFHTFRTKLGIKDSERHLVLKYCGALHRYIQTEMDFLDISSLGVAYQYAVKIEKKFKLSYRKRRVTGRKEGNRKNGEISTNSLGTTPMNIAQNSHWWSRSKTRSQNLILKILVKDRSSTQTPLLLS
jgi:hypothetical protein